MRSLNFFSGFPINFPLRNLLAGLLVILLALPSCRSVKNVSSAGQTSSLTEKEKVALKEEFMDGVREKITGNFEKAAYHFDKCLKIDPQHAAAMYELASIYEFQKQDAVALKLMQEAVKLSPENEWYRQLLGTLYAKTGNFSESVKIYKQLAHDHFVKIEYYYEWANMLLYQNKLKDALEVYDQIEKMVGVTEEISLQKEKIWLKLGNTENAIIELKKLIEQYPKESKYFGLLAELYQSLGKADLAMELYDQMKKIDPKNPYVHLSLSNFYREKGEKEKSFEEMKLAFANADLSVDVKVNILLSYYAADHEELKVQSAELCRILAETHPEDAKSYSIYGDFLTRDKQYAGARDQYRKAILLDSSKFPIWNQLMFLESELKDYEALFNESKAAIELFPNQPSFYFFHGFAAIQKKEYREAVKTLEEGKELVIDNNPLLEQFYSTLGDAYNSLKDYVNSDSSYEKALLINPDNVYVLNNYSYYLSLRKENLERAEKMSKRSNELEPDSPSFLDTYGWILYQLGRYEEAENWIEKALAAGADNNGTILEHYGDILFKLNDKNGALNYWNRAKNAGEGSELLDKKIAEKLLIE